MSLVNNSVETVNAAATAIVSAETRVQPTSVQKRRWGGCWSLYWCFGSYKQSKQINHALLVPESSSTTAPPPTTQTTQNSNTVVFPFIAPPSSPASFLQSDPPSASYSPVGLLSFKSFSQNPHVSSSIFTVGPYAYETQLVSPPVFSTYNTEPSTASFTPPPESVQITTPSSPEVPFAQLLTSSLARARRHSLGSKSNYEFQPYTGSSPGSTIPNSGTSSPFLDKQHKNLKWGSRLGSPNGSLTPNGWGSRLGSGSLTPNGNEMSQISEVASLANSATSSPKRDQTLVDHRVSFELTHLDVVNNLEASRSSSSGHRQKEGITITTEMVIKVCEYCVGMKNLETQLEVKEKVCCCNRKSVSRDFNFEAVGVEMGSEKNWTFFPMLQPSGKPS